MEAVIPYRSLRTVVGGMLLQILRYFEKSKVLQKLHGYYEKRLQVLPHPEKNTLPEKKTLNLGSHLDP